MDSDGRACMMATQDWFYDQWNGPEGLRRLNVIFDELPALRDAILDAEFQEARLMWTVAEDSRLVLTEHRKKLTSIINEHDE